MALTPSDLEQIAGLIKAGQCGYLPPTLLGQQLHWAVTIFVNPQVGDVAAPANANRVWIGFLADSVGGVTPEGLDPVLSMYFPVNVNFGAPWPLTVHHDGVIPQLAWTWALAVAGNAAVLELTWSPPTGLGLT
jgi:hypothetical protein